MQDPAGSDAPPSVTPVTCTVTGEPIVSLLPTPARPEGPRVTAVREIGEHRVHVLVKDLPQLRLEKALAEVVSGVWMRKERGAALQLEPDPAALRERETLLAQRKQRFFAGLRNLVKQLSLDQEGLERLRKTEPTSAGYLSNPASRAAIQLTALLGEKQWQELEATGRLTVTAEQLGTEGTSLLRECTPGG
jgi:hypothetical protein